MREHTSCIYVENRKKQKKTVFLIKVLDLSTQCECACRVCVCVWYAWMWQVKFRIPLARTLKIDKIHFIPSLQRSRFTSVKIFNRLLVCLWNKLNLVKPIWKLHIRKFTLINGNNGISHFTATNACWQKKNTILIIDKC